jgi:hypothetical protein
MARRRLGDPTISTRRRALRAWEILESIVKRRLSDTAISVDAIICWFKELLNVLGL